jgi:hypothetical protein
MSTLRGESSEETLLKNNLQGFDEVLSVTPQLAAVLEVNDIKM